MEKKKEANWKYETKNKKETNWKYKTKKSYHIWVSNPDRSHRSLLYPPLNHSCKHANNEVKLYIIYNFSITMDTIKFFLKFVKNLFIW